MGFWFTFIFIIRMGRLIFLSSTSLPSSSNQVNKILFFQVFSQFIFRIERDVSKAALEILERIQLSSCDLSGLSNLNWYM